MGGQTILLVDDEVKQRKKMRRTLEAVGYKVMESRDYAEASAIYQRFSDRIDLLLVDVCLPGNYGCELARRALTGRPELRVLLMSGSTGAEVCRFYGISATDVHFLAKPFREADLLARVAYLLEDTSLGGKAAGVTTE